jgi:hypothetical protein
MEDQNPLKAQNLTETQETINKLIQNTQKEYPQKTLEVFNYSNSEKMPYGLHKSFKCRKS